MAKSQKKRIAKKGDKNWASITMQIDDQRFHEEGDQVEVQAKFCAWLDKQFGTVFELGAEDAPERGK
jgi:hypothetical protein